jgi:hypothetical protein
MAEAGLFHGQQGMQPLLKCFIIDEMSEGNERIKKGDEGIST